MTGVVPTATKPTGWIAAVARRTVVRMARATTPAALAAALALLAGRGVSAADAPGGPPPPPPVTVSQPIQKSVVEWDEYTGQFAAVDYVEIRARVSGYLDSINFQDGQLVKKGDLLFVIDPRPYAIALQSAKAQLAQATAQVELSQRELARAAELIKKDYVSGSVYDQRTQQVRNSAGQLEAAKAAVNSAELNIEFTRILAPVGGRVSAHQVSVGNLVTGGDGGATTLLTSVVSLDPIHFNFDMSEADYLAYQRAVGKGTLQSAGSDTVAVYAHLPDEKAWPHQGKLDFIDNQVDRSSGTIRARAMFPNPSLFIAPGQFGRLRVPGSDAYDALLIPDGAVVTDQSRKIVMLVKEDGTVEARPIRPGPMIDGLRVVREGIGPGDKVIIEGLVRARPGAKVTAQPGQIKPEDAAS